MAEDALKKLIAFYEDQIRNCEESLEQAKIKNFGETSKAFGEANVRYKEGFRDALKMVTEHLEHTINTVK